MTTLLAHITIKSGQENKFEAIMKDMVAQTLSQEEGVLRYEYYKGQAANHYYCLLAFKDKWAFYRHQNSDHHEGHDFGAVLESIRLEYLGPVQDANSLPPTVDLPLTDAQDESMARAEKSYPIAVPDWWAERA
ncbi:MAG: antibiotic biosynthesis monooxygenase [Pseudomonadales bacterium]|nr:antibiotic biosynthesis monooxygenase [Pseudomonadales bacterium]